VELIAIMDWIVSPRLRRQQHRPSTRAATFLHRRGPFSQSIPKVYPIESANASMGGNICATHGRAMVL
jgi:hypothetical protein